MRLIFLTLVVSLGLSLTVVGQPNKPKSLRDSLLMFYSDEEIKEMPTYERYNAVRKMRGQEVITIPGEKSGVSDVVGLESYLKVDSLKTLIDNRVSEIEAERKNYRQEIFPNSHIDVFDGFFGGFYSDVKNRVPAHIDFRNYSYDDSWGGKDVRTFRNNTRRVYYFSSDGSLRLITVEYGYNINEAPHDDSYDLQNLSYQRKSFYVWSDTLQYVQQVSANQKSQAEFSFTKPDITMEEMAKSPAACESDEYYYYKNSCILHLQRKGELSTETWHEDLQRLPINNKGICKSTNVILLNNFVIERKDESIKEYLMPVEQSFLQPYFLKGKE